MSQNSVCKYGELRRGDSLVSNNGEYTATFQDDANFVIYTKCRKAIWASDTWNTGASRLCMQDDCNLVMYNDADKPIWQTDTHRNGNNSCLLRLTNDGHLLVFRNAEQIWSSANSKGMKL